MGGDRVNLSVEWEYRPELRHINRINRAKTNSGCDDLERSKQAAHCLFWQFNSRDWWADSTSNPLAAQVL